MGVFSRFMDIINANINSLLDQAEDPEKMIKLMIQEMEDTIIEIKSSCASTMASKAKTTRTVSELESLVERWQKRAELAIAKGREDLAREALIEKKKAMADLEALKAEEKRYSDIVSDYKTDISKLEEKLSAAKLKYQSMLEKVARAKDSIKSSDVYKKAGDRDTMYRFSRMEERIDKMNAQNELNQEADDVESRFRDLEELEEIEKELEALRKKTGK